MKNYYVNMLFFGFFLILNSRVANAIDYDLLPLTDKEHRQSLALAIIWTGAVVSQLYVSNNNLTLELLSVISPLIWASAGLASVYILSERAADAYKYLSHDS